MTSPAEAEAVQQLLDLTAERASRHERTAGPDECPAPGHGDRYWLAPSAGAPGGERTRGPPAYRTLNIYIACSYAKMTRAPRAEHPGSDGACREVWTQEMPAASGLVFRSSSLSGIDVGEPPC